uniref:Uncharacterized protein n=1 Tax=Setaria viridis TaxID=4556 RepID=A0A4U6WE05_SETVI|nr:hypothetical protein SEVIR_2G418150v2 [Setaria viridis]
MPVCCSFICFALLLGGLWYVPSINERSSACKTHKCNLTSSIDRKSKMVCL